MTFSSQAKKMLFFFFTPRGPETLKLISFQHKVWSRVRQPLADRPSFSHIRRLWLWAVFRAARGPSGRRPFPRPPNPIRRRRISHGLTENVTYCLACPSKSAAAGGKRGRQPTTHAHAIASQAGRRPAVNCKCGWLILSGDQGWTQIGQFTEYVVEQNNVKEQLRNI